MNASIPVMHGLILTGVLFMLGLLGVLLRRNILFKLLSIEIMLNASGLAFIIGANKWFQIDGQVVFLFILGLAASGLAVGLALVMQYHKRFKTLDVSAGRLMKD